MRYPPRLAHLATRQVVVAKLLATYAQAHQLDDEEAAQRLDRALQGSLLEDLLAATWEAMRDRTKRLDDAALVEKVADTLHDRPLRRAKAAPLTPALSAFMVLVDLAAGTASDAARRVLEGPQGRAMSEQGLREAGELLARELTRGK